MSTVRVSGATITLVKVAGVNGDTLNPSITTATTTTDAQGAYRIDNLAPAYYRIDVVAPAGSPYENATSGIGPARETEVKVFVSLLRKP
jgi:protocatechuate 3,4-dioxygenase beta subunit